MTFPDGGLTRNSRPTGDTFRNMEARKHSSRTWSGKQAHSLLAPVVEAGLVYVAMMLAFRPLALALGGGVASDTVVKLVVFVLFPVVWVLASSRRPASFGLSFDQPGPSFRAAARAYRIVGPGCLVFPLMAWIGSSPDQWLGSILATLVFAGALPLVAKVTATLPSRSAGADNSLTSALLLFSSAAAVTALIAPTIPIVSRILYYGIVVGFSEEIAFRGFLQSCLNRAFGRPWQWHGVRFGPALPIVALLFGLAHAIVGSGFPVPLAIFTMTLGLTFGFIREKTGSVLAAAFLHGLADLPLAFFGRP